MPDPDSKLGKLARAERRLRGAIRSGAPARELERAAERVRAAHLGLFKAHKVIASGPEQRSADTERQLSNIEESIRLWQRLSIADIVRRYTADE